MYRSVLLSTWRLFPVPLPLAFTQGSEDLEIVRRGLRACMDIMAHGLGCAATMPHRPALASNTEVKLAEA